MALRWPDAHDTVDGRDPAAFRRWLEEHHDTAAAVWLMYWKKPSGVASITWTEAVDDALCFGWIDSTIQPLDADRYVQYFTRRKVGSMWSRVNKAKVERLTDAGLMHPAGQAAIDRARADGSWTLLDAAEALIVPDDLAAAFDATPGARDFFESMSNTGKLNVLRWVYLAKRPATRAARVEEIVRLHAVGRSPRPT